MHSRCDQELLVGATHVLHSKTQTLPLVTSCGMKHTSIAPVSVPDIVAVGGSVPTVGDVSSDRPVTIAVDDDGDTVAVAAIVVSE